MVKMSETEVPFLTLEELPNDGTGIANPSADHRAAFIGEDGEWHFKDSAGTVTDPGGGGGSGNLAGTELDYAQITSDVTVSGTGTDEAGTTLVVAGASVAYDGATIVLIEFFSPGVSPSPTSDRDIRFYLFDGSTNLGFIGHAQTNVSSGVSMFHPIHCARRLTPSNASHTYSIRAGRSGGDGTVKAGAGGAGPAFLPAFIRITRVSN